jgi:guanosine-3',5'-bis(diphosphate) 3'-pyrophosphohydrolase
LLQNALFDILQSKDLDAEDKMIDTTSQQDRQEKDKQEILSAYRSLMRACEDLASRSERREIRRAFEYALQAHEGARRKSGEPYILHPIAVAKIAAKEMHLDATSVIAALLHDVVEDTFAEIADIKAEFGSEVATIIDGLTKISGVFDNKSSAQAENFRKMLLTLSADVRVILIKLADRLHNMRTLQYMKKEGQLKIASETIYLYAPLANRLGLHAVKVELEDLALKYTEPTIYLQINSKLVRVQRESRYYILQFIRSIREKLSASGMQFRILHRFKSVYSIYAKMVKQEIPFEEVFDLFAIRIIIDSPSDLEKSECWRAYSLVTELYRPNPERMRDWLTIPKSNGYESLHVTVMGPRGRWIEVQIRSERMDYGAEHGMAAHWKYKDGTQMHDERFLNWLGRVRELLENPNLNAVDVVKEFKTNLVPDEAFVFTPKGDLKQLPAGSTVIDFAYEIHSLVGDTCIGAKVNNKVVPLSYTLNNGDQVEIITSKKQSPKDEWLQYAHTTKAQHKIKESLKLQRRTIEDKGREIFKWKARNYSLDKKEVIKELLAFFKIPNEGQFFYLLGLHKLDMDRLQEFIRIKEQGGKIRVEDLEPTKKNIKSRLEFEEWLKENKGMTSDSLLIGEDMDIRDYKFATCCHPVPGDDILAFFVPDEGLVIHRPNCPKAVSLMSNWGKNIIKAKWTEMSDISLLAGVKIIGEDRQGMMNDLIRVVSGQMKLNIRSITIDSMDGMFEGVFKVFVRNTKELENLGIRLKTVPGVFTVSRVDHM